MEMSILHVLVLDYVVGVYPLLLIVLTYTAVLLHDRYLIVVKLWKPLHVSDESGIFSTSTWFLLDSVIREYLIRFVGMGKSQNQ